jgi:hypothetical protein
MFQKQPFAAHKKVICVEIMCGKQPKQEKTGEKP